VSRDVRSRVTLGVGIPAAAFVFLAALIFAFSRILLAVPPALAPLVAILFAATIVAGCTLAAMIRGTRGFAFLIGVLVLTIVMGGVAGAVLGEYPVQSLVEEEAGGPQGEPGAAPPAETQSPGESPPAGESPPPAEQPGGGGGVVAITAQNTAFDTTTIDMPPEQQVTISFTNNDPLPHNLSIYTAAGGEPVFQGEVVTGPTTVEYSVVTPPPGTYFFQCDVHPQMTGNVAVG
jgi:plastocyanin